MSTETGITPYFDVAQSTYAFFFRVAQTAALYRYFDHIVVTSSFIIPHIVVSKPYQFETIVKLRKLPLHAMNECADALPRL